MPVLDFKGKQFVYAHHLTVPFRQLDIEADKSMAKDGEPSLNDNLIIHGDNLHALKALLPKYSGKIDCIYIDPPYNTGEEKWCYNDSVNSPLMKEWLKDSANPVDKEDLERHDKWLCMMWPRLQLLKELLSDKGTIFISIDENEYMHLKTILNEVFGENSHVATIVWQKRYSRENREAIGDVHEYIVVYSLDPINFKNIRNLVDANEDQLEVYRNPNDDPRGRWRPIPMTAQAGHATKDQFYEIVAPGGKTHVPPKGRCWGIAQDTFEKLKNDGRIYFGQDGNSQPNIIRYLDEVEGFVPWTWWPSEEAGHTDEAKKEIYSIVGRELDFDTPKPTRLIRRLLKIATNANSIILDSFAGSGTTAHAVMQLNNDDNGQRKFILVECEDYAENLTALRVGNIIAGYNSTQNIKEELLQIKLTPAVLKKMPDVMSEAEALVEKNEGRFSKIKQECKKGIFHVYGEIKKDIEVQGLGGSFTYCELGQEINIENLLKGKTLPSYEELARYAFYTATGLTLDEVKTGADYLIGETENYRVHLVYKPELEFLRAGESALNMPLAKSIFEGRKDTGKTALVFATHKFMGQKELTEMGIIYCQLPYAIHRVMGD